MKEATRFMNMVKERTGPLVDQSKTLLNEYDELGSNYDHSDEWIPLGPYEYLNLEWFEASLKKLQAEESQTELSLIELGPKATKKILKKFDKYSAKYLKLKIEKDSYDHIEYRLHKLNRYLEDLLEELGIDIEEEDLW